MIKVVMWLWPVLAAAMVVFYIVEGKPFFIVWWSLTTVGFAYMAWYMRRTIKKVERKIGDTS